MNPAEEKSAVRGGRRVVLTSLGKAGLIFLAAGSLPGAGSGFSRIRGAVADEPSMSPNEDLMQEHALLNRVLLAYEEAIRRLDGRANLDPGLLKSSAQIIRDFVELYHEKLEENYVFPRFEKENKLVDLVAVLRRQHAAGRLLTQEIIAASTALVFGDEVKRKKLVRALSSFIRMYRPHETREGSVLFPAFRDLVPAREFEALGDLFEKKEHELLGVAGFEGQVRAVEVIEKKLGIYELSQYTPRNPSGEGEAGGGSQI